MKKILLLCVALLSVTASFAQQDANRVFVFTDKDGNEYENATTIVRDELDIDEFEETAQILSGLYIKKTASDKTYAVQMSVAVSSIDNGMLKACFPNNCLTFSASGTGTVGKSVFTEAPSYSSETGLADMLTEWIPSTSESWGQCTATFTLTTLVKNSFVDYTTVGTSSTITVQFVNRDPAGINGVTDNDAAKVVARYTTGGQRINAPVKGINIVKLSDGRTVKLNVK
jgi:hypothetical protein